MGATVAVQRRVRAPPLAGAGRYRPRGRARWGRLLRYRGLRERRPERGTAGSGRLRRRHLVEHLPAVDGVRPPRRQTTTHPRLPPRAWRPTHRRVTRTHAMGLRLAVVGTGQF